MMPYVIKNMPCEGCYCISIVFVDGRKRFENAIGKDENFLKTEETSLFFLNTRISVDKPTMVINRQVVAVK